MGWWPFLGRRAASVLAAAGAQVVGVARRREALEDWKAETGENAAIVVADVADRDGIPALAKAARPLLLKGKRKISMGSP